MIDMKKEGKEGKGWDPHVPRGKKCRERRKGERERERERDRPVGVVLGGPQV